VPDGSADVGLGRRQAARLRMVAEARLTTRDGTRPVRIDDLSQTGAHLSRPGNEPFTWCVLRWAGHEFYGEMIWTKPGQCGIRFEQELGPAQILALKSRFPNVDESVKLPVPDRRRRL
jgi:hypothetical protein